ncbi:MAG: hypothetical protein WD379_03320 [Dehalococcoidia bacterium]
MNDERSVHDAFLEARDAVAKIEDEDYRKIAFQVVFARLLDASPATAPAPANTGSRVARDLTAGLVAQKLSVGEFLAHFNPGSYLESTAAIAYYFLHNLQQEGVTRQEFLASFRTARLTPPKNISDVIAQCIRKGLLMDASERRNGQKAWAITQTGERLVENRLRSLDKESDA